MNLAAMKKAIMKKRSEKLGSNHEDLGEKNANLNPGEGQQDDLDVHHDRVDVGLAPSSHEDMAHEAAESPDFEAGEHEGALEGPEPMDHDLNKMDPRHAMLESLHMKDHMGKPGIKGKAAALIHAAMMKYKK